MTSELRVDKIIPTTGAPTGGGGGIIQVKHLTKTDSFSTTSTSLVDITGFSLSITPKFNTSKIMVLASGYISSQGNNHGVHLFFYRTISGQSDVEVGKSYNQKSKCTITNWWNFSNSKS